MARMTRYWTLSERNAQLPSITGMLLWNACSGSASAWLMSRDVALFKPVRSGTGGGGSGARKVRRPWSPNPATRTPPRRRTRPAPGRSHPALRRRRHLAPVPGAVALRHPGVLKGVAFGVMLAFGIFNLFGSIACRTCCSAPSCCRSRT
jgi:hypothetical protein